MSSSFEQPPAWRQYRDFLRAMDPQLLLRRPGAYREWWRGLDVETQQAFSSDYAQGYTALIAGEIERESALTAAHLSAQLSSPVSEAEVTSSAEA